MKRLENWSPIEGTSEPAARSLLWLALLSLLFVPSLLWIWHDRSAWDWDTSWYGEVSVEMHAAMQRGFRPWLNAMIDTLPNRTPGLMWIGQFFVPLGSRLGNPVFGLLVWVLLLQVAGAYLLFRALATLFGSASAALISTAMVCSAPLFVGMSHAYFTEPFQGFGVALFFAVLAGADKRAVLRSVLLLSLAVVAAVLGKIAAPVYLVLPGLLFLVLVWQRRRNMFDRGTLGLRDGYYAMLLAALAAPLCVWLVFHHQDALGHAVNASSGAASIYYGSRAGLWAKWQLWTAKLAGSYFHPVILPLVLVAGAACVLMAVRNRGAFRWPDRVAAAAAAQIVFLLLIFSLNVNEDSRFLFSLYPAVGVVLCWILTRSNLRAALTVFTGLALAQYVLVFAQAHGCSAVPRAVSPYLAGIDLEGANLATVKEGIRATCAAVSGAPVFAVGLDLARFNANTLAFYAALERRSGEGKCYYRNLGVAEADPAEAWRRLIDSNPSAVLFLRDELDRIHPADVFNRVSLPVFQRLQADRRFRLRRIPSEPNLLSFERVGAAKWVIRSALFGGQAAVVHHVNGTADWKVHPSRRQDGEQTVLELSEPLAGRSEFQAEVAYCDERCRGVTLEIAVGGDRGRKLEHPLPRPVAGRRIALALGDEPGDMLTIRIRSLDRKEDNVDYCWLTVTGVRIVSAAGGFPRQSP